jgi:hypothetical protein
MEELGFPNDPEEWRLFIDASKVILKDVLLLNGNTKPSISVAHSVAKKESYKSMSLLLKAINCKKQCWQICGDLKVTGPLLRLHKGYTSIAVFLLVGQASNKKHYIVKDSPTREDFVPGKHNVRNAPLVNPEKVLLPPLRIKLGLLKNYVKALDKSGEGFFYLRSK